MLCPALAVVSHWFSRKRRGFALGIISIGSSSGSTVLPAAAQKLIPLIGFVRTICVFGFILIATLGAANLLLQRRLPPSNVHGGLFDLKTFLNKAFAFYCISGTMTFLGLYRYDQMLTYISVSAIEIGVSKDFVFYIISISNASSAVGRLLTGIIGDKIGAMNTMTPFTALAGIMTIPSTGMRGNLFIATYQLTTSRFSCGAFSSLWPVPIVAMGGIKDAGRRAGMFMSFVAFGAIAGPPISGALISPIKGFVYAGYYAGGTIVISIVLMLVARYFHLRRLWGKFS
ncbi:MFS general substrate transporter [Rhizopogon vinicolor AM-OR11-026]|uniref:MFS general substrate transporter n=1 Tax=Rhizopogon vinicolor AM-OR11-026 TaxID=1314800 RepID=A0A1B7MKE8_9AGAM|nr:MFS general substrate transporter [Rhizopogon vinicolor AM-OR11-026]